MPVGFGYPSLLYHPTAHSMVLFHNSCYSNHIRIDFHYHWPATSLIFQQLLPLPKSTCRCLIVAHNTADLPQTAFTISNIFIALKPNLAQNFIVTRCSKFFSISNHDTSTWHTLTKDDGIVSLMNQSSWNLVCSEGLV